MYRRDSRPHWYMEPTLEERVSYEMAPIPEYEACGGIRGWTLMRVGGLNRRWAW